jgi:hypothetical protein
VHPVMHLVDHTACSFLKGKRQDRMDQSAEPGGKQLGRNFAGKQQVLEIGFVNRLRVVGEQAGDLDWTSSSSLVLMSDCVG